MNKVKKLQGDARDFLNTKLAEAQQVINNEQQRLLTFHSAEGQQITIGIEDSTGDLKYTTVNGPTFPAAVIRLEQGMAQNATGDRVVDTELKDAIFSVPN